MKKLILIFALALIGCSAEDDPTCDEALTMKKLNQGFDNMLKMGADPKEVEAWRSEATSDPCGVWEREFGDAQ